MELQNALWLINTLAATVQALTARIEELEGHKCQSPSE